MMNSSHNHSRREAGLLVPFRATHGDHDHQGTLGDEAVSLLRYMQNTGFGVLHDLPCTPPDEYNCPYSSVSSFALDPQRIELERLVQFGDLSRDELNGYQNLVSSENIGPEIAQAKQSLLKRAFVNFDNLGSPERKSAYVKWCEQEAYWLDSYVVFEILSRLPENAGKRWQAWETGKDCSPELLAGVKAIYGQEFMALCYAQWIVEEQTLGYLKTAERLGIEVWGDVPFYVGGGEVWANRGIFNLDADGNQLNQGGAPPSATSSTGQMWGNATYKIDPENFPVETGRAIDWWLKRLARASKLSVGKVRLDHFIGLAEPYIIPKGAVDGSSGWREAGVGEMLFDKLVDMYGRDLPFYPEDLGEMTEKTPELRDRYGMLTTRLAVRGLTKDLVAGAQNYDNSLNNPDNYHRGVVSFSGNHDSPTLVQAIDGIRQRQPEALGHYIWKLQQRFPDMGITPETSAEVLANLEMERVIRSAGEVAILAAWDLLSLGAEAQYNKPATVSGANWSWRMTELDFRRLERQAQQLRTLIKSSDRFPADAKNIPA